MLEKYLEKETLSIVFAGEFNPLIFQPYWLFSKNLIRESEAQGAKVEVMHPEVVKYALEWVDIEITRHKCILNSTLKPYFDSVKDLAENIFKILKETPITSFGINHVFDISLKNEKAFYDFGNTLTPLDIWSESVKEPRLFILEIYEKDRKDGQNGSRRFRVSPSQDLQINFGVAFNINNHFNISSKKAVDGISKLNENWENSFKDTIQIINDVLSKTIK